MPHSSITAAVLNNITLNHTDITTENTKVTTGHIFINVYKVISGKRVYAVPRYE